MKALLVLKERSNAASVRAKRKSSLAITASSGMRLQVSPQLARFSLRFDLVDWLCVVAKACKLLGHAQKQLLVADFDKPQNAVKTLFEV